MRDDEGAGRRAQGAGPDTPGPGPALPASGARAGALYQELILQHYRRPRNRGPVDGATAAAERRNPLCGDAIAMEVRLAADVVRAAGFTGQGCSITQAAASLLTEAVRGLALDEARALVRSYVALVAGDPAAADDGRLGDLVALGGVSRFPARIRCALLPAEALAEALGGGGDVPGGG